MAEGLPEGLITNNENVTSEINRLHEVDVDDIIRMWQGNEPSPILMTPFMIADRPYPQFMLLAKQSFPIMWVDGWRIFSGECGEVRRYFRISRAVNWPHTSMPSPKMAHFEQHQLNLPGHHGT